MYKGSNGGARTATLVSLTERLGAVALLSQASVIALSVVQPASAQSIDMGNTEEYDQPLLLQELQVEGELQTRSVQDTQTSVTVVPGVELDSSPETGLYDVIERTPNVTSTFGEQGFAIRGVDQRGPGSAGSGLLVNVTVDGVSLPDNQATFFGPYGTWDLAQVEVLRGPQSTQQGRNALAGAIVIRTADPTYDQELKLRAQGGSHDTYGGAFAFNTPITDKVAIRIAAEANHTDGYIDNPTLNMDDYDAQELASGRFKMLFEPFENFKGILTLSQTYNSGGEDYIDFSEYPDNRYNFSSEPADEASRHSIAGLRLFYDFNEAWAIESETSYYYDDYSRIEDFLNSAAEDGTLSRERDTYSFEEDLRLRYASSTVDGVLGFYYTDIHAKDKSQIDVPANVLEPSLPGFIQINRSIDTTIDTRNWAIFGEAEVEVMEDLRVIAGGRYDNESVDDLDDTTYSSSFPLPPGVLPPSQVTSSDTTYDAFLPKFGLVYDWTQDLSTGFTVQRGYRAGGTQLNTFTGQVNEFDPEYTWNYELSVRSQWWDQRLTVNANAFYTRWSDQQVNVFGPSGLTIDFNTINAGKSEIYGGELSVELYATENLDLYADLGIARTNFLEFEDQGVDLSGNQFPFASEVTGGFGASYYFPYNIELHGDASYTGPQFMTVDNNDDLKSDGRFLLNARIGYATETFSAFLYGRNLLDVDYVTQIVPDRSQVRAGDPLTVGVLLNANF